MKYQDRAIIKAEMEERGQLRYRITASDSVHFYGLFPHAQGMTGWWLVHGDARKYVKMLKRDIAERLERSYRKRLGLPY